MPNLFFINLVRGKLLAHIIYIYIYTIFLNETQELNWVCLIRETFKILQGVLQDRFGNHWPNKRLSTRIKLVTAHRKSIDYE